MGFVHTTCGGNIDTKKRQCLRCKRKWNRFSFLFTTELRMVVPTKRATEQALRAKKNKPKERKGYASWADKLPGVPEVARRLPNWPRWARILLTSTIVYGFVRLFLYWRGC